MSQRHVIVVTGATGRVGHLVVERLLAVGHSVRAVGRTADKLTPLAGIGADVRPGSYDERAFLASAFKGANAAFVLTPVDTSAKDVNEVQYNVIEGLFEAIRDSSVRHVVLLSSWGAELATRVGGIIGCYRFEQLLDGITNLNVVHLRPVWFMENFLWNIPLIKMAGINGLAIKADVAFPMIAARDIAPVAADYLTGLDFKGRNVRYLNGPRDYSMAEVTRILGASVGKPDLKYVEFPDAVFRKGLISGGGLTPNAADMAIEINRGIDCGLVKAEPRSAVNTTPTTLEEFARTTFAPAFKAAPEAGFGDRFGGFLLRSYLFATGHRAA
jgi:uncharacterized protein YbjT (DUF2867 family)